MTSLQNNSKQKKNTKAKEKIDPAIELDATKKGSVQEEGLSEDEKRMLEEDLLKPPSKTPSKKGVKKGTKRTTIEPGFKLQFNLSYLQLRKELSIIQEEIYSQDSGISPQIKNIDDDTIASQLTGITKGYLKNFRNADVSLHSDLYKLAVLADYLGVNLIGGKEDRDNALFIKVSSVKHEKNPDIEISGLVETID